MSLQRAEEVEAHIDERLGLRMYQVEETAVPDIISRVSAAGAPRISANVVLSLGWHISCGNCPRTVPENRVQALSSEVPKRPATAPGSQPIRVGLIDSGVADHPWLSGRVEKRAGSQDDDVMVRRDDGTVEHGFAHGTFTASQIVRKAPDATVVVRRATGEDGTIDDVTLANALLELGDLEEGVDVINLAMNAYTPGDMGLLATGAALRLLFAENPDLQVVAAAGNHASLRMSWPAAFKRVIGVGAVDANGSPAFFASQGYHVDCCALGVDVEGAFPLEDDVLWPHTAGPRDYSAGFATWSGSSFATGQVAGAIAAEMRDGSTGREAAEKLIFSRPLQDSVPGLGPRVG